MEIFVDGNGAWSVSLIFSMIIIYVLVVYDPVNGKQSLYEYRNFSVFDIFYLSSVIIHCFVC